jgi:8-oxo-dGTP pyrophosphatase MutT (NUDIX family)
MYKVFINNKRIILANNKEVFDYGNAAVVCLKKPEVVHSVIRNHLINGSAEDFVILSPDDKKLIAVFESNYDIRIAAGGWVWNEDGELLMILREGVWDLPKGHLDEGESLEECALREVEEETGIEGLKLGKAIGISRHTYEYDGRMLIKESHWYRMTAPKMQHFIPQSNEGIELVQWIPTDEIEKTLEKAWASLREFYWDNKDEIIYAI